MVKYDIGAILGRPEFSCLVDQTTADTVDFGKVLITGANGSVGTHLRQVFDGLGVQYLATDIDGNLEYLDITNFRDCVNHINNFKPDYIVNIAGLKYATKSEHQAWRTVQVNVEGTKNLIDAAPKGCKIVLTSTCKSANPEIVYGATKLIAERMVINAGGSVARFFNVVQSQGNVFEIWDKVPPNEPIRVVEGCKRYFISADEATGLVLYAMSNSGRFIVNTPNPRRIEDIAANIYPNREQVLIPRRRGDRQYEIFLSTSEKEVYKECDGAVLRIIGDHDLRGNFTE
jgi:FlaA1/EpsC-like NDP-sugar epimerase